MHKEIDQDAHDPKRILEAVTELIEARPIEQLQNSLDTLYGFYRTHKQPVGGAIARAIEVLTTFLGTLQTITATPGPVNGHFEHEFNALGRKLHTLRIAAGQGEETVADAIGIELSLLQRFEQGQCGDIRLGLMEEFADYYNVPVKTLLLAVRSERFTGSGDQRLPTDQPEEDKESDEDAHHD